MAKARTLGCEWTEMSSYQSSPSDHREGGETLMSTDHDEDNGDILDGLRSGLIFSAILWVALIAAGLLVLV